MFSIPCVIFAGGKSSRMGEDKALLPFGDAPTLTQYQFNRLQKLFPSCYIATKDPTKFAFDAPFLLDPSEYDNYAPTLGFIAAFRALESESFFALSVDTPFVTEVIMQGLIDADREDDYDATVAETKEGIQPLCGIYHKTLLPSFETMAQQQQHKLGYLLKQVKTNYLFFDNSEPFFNINHPNEYREALTTLQES